MFFANRKFSLLALMVIATCAHAQGPSKAPTMPQAPVEIITESAPPPPPQNAARATTLSAISAAEVQRINESMTVKTARLSELELEAKIAAKTKEVQSFRATANGGTGPFESSAGAPSVVSVAGLKGHLEAVLVFQGGIVQRVKVGDVIGDRKVTSIGVHEVLLSDLKGKNVQRLGFGASAITREGASSSSGMPIPMPGAQFPAAPR